MLTVVVMSYGEPGNQYCQFVDRWWSSVVAINPAEVIVVHTDPEPLGLLAKAPSQLNVRSMPMAGSHPVALNVAIEAATQPWVSAIGVDDCYRPGATELLPQADAMGAEIMLWDHYEIGSHVWRTFWNAERLTTANTVQGASPFRRSLWQRAGGFPDIAWSDWGFWLRCAKAGAKTVHFGTVGVDFDPGLTHQTFSGHALSKSEREARDHEAYALAAELGL